jgi:hypothetical protein
VKKALLVFPLTTIIAFGILTKIPKPGENAPSDKIPLTPSENTGIGLSENISTAGPAAAAAETVTEAEWNTFRKEAEKKILRTEEIISGYKSGLQGLETSQTTAKKLKEFEARLDFEKKRLDAFAKNKVNWDVFETGFNNEMAVLVKDLKALAAENR